MVLAGGRVDELGVLTHLRPKSTVPFGGLYRFIDFPLSNLMNSGIEKVGILSQYRSSSLVEHIGNGASWDMVGRDRGITILPPFQGMHESDWYKGTADAVYQNLDFISSYRPDMVLVLSGDHVYHMDYRPMIRFHREMNADVTAAFVQVPLGGASRFGLAVMADEHEYGGRITEYVEKPEQPMSNWASMTAYLFDFDTLVTLLEANSRQESHEFGKDILPGLHRTHRFYGYRFNGFWAYCRTIEEYWQTSMNLLGENPAVDIGSWQLRTNLVHEDIRDRGPAMISPYGGVVEDVVAYNGVRIEGSVKRSILFPGVYVAPGAEVEDSILFFDTQVGTGARLQHTITDIGVTIGRDCAIGGKGRDITVIGMHAEIPRDITVMAGCSVNPGMRGEQFRRKTYPALTEIGE
jgi:glucose-1-phosphate adenylyltransferase